MPIWLPPIEEQASIVDYIGAALARIEGLPQLVQTAISKLLEYRATLISAAVTGKIDVRGEAA